jgi:TPR repeat protein
VMYARGQGVLQDSVKAHMWFNLAAAKGDADGAHNRDSLAKRMTPQQIAEAQKMARDCLARNLKGCD